MCPPTCHFFFFLFLTYYFSVVSDSWSFMIILYSAPSFLLPRFVQTSLRHVLVTHHADFCLFSPPLAVSPCPECPSCSVLSIKIPSIFLNQLKSSKVSPFGRNISVASETLKGEILAFVNLPLRSL